MIVHKTITITTVGKTTVIGITITKDIEIRKTLLIRQIKVKTTNMAKQKYKITQVGFNKKIKKIINSKIHNLQKTKINKILSQMFNKTKI